MPLLAKLSPPRLFDVAPRERLFSALDRCRSHPTVWVEGPPGAGKTSLVASYLEARAIPATWYQVDAGDADVATLFHYLGRVGENAGSRALPSLPLLTPEQMPELAAFSRSYFREFYARLDPLTTLVIDNFQDAAHSPAFVTAIQCALAEIPPGSNVIILSRGMPPLPFARLQTTAAIAVLDWEQLMLSEDEAAQIAGLDAGTGAAHDLLRACGGWVAGVGERVFLGGRDTALIADLAARLKQVGIIAETSGHKYPGSDPGNICNRGNSKTGVQFELSLAFRNGTQVPAFVAAVRSVLCARQDAT